MKVVKKALHMKPGKILEVLGDCPTFEDDLRAWCQETGRRVMSVESKGGDTNIIQIKC
jgi:tRNA 2-thiouridine synthesizing protein A